MPLPAPPKIYDNPELEAWLLLLWLAINDMPSSTVPTATGSTGIKGQWAFDSSFIYICIDTDTWERVGIAAW